jgi:hypothetical protein
MSPLQPQPVWQSFKARSCLGCLMVLVFLILAGGGVYYGLSWWSNQAALQQKKERKEKVADPTNARYVKVGDCLVKSPTHKFPDNMVIGRCSAPHSYKVIERYDDADATRDCAKGTHVYDVSDPSKQERFKVCMTKN